MGMTLQALNQLTIAQYGFKVEDWDDRPDNETIVIGKHSFSPPDANSDPNNEVKYVSMNLHGLSVQQVGEIFSKIFQEYTGSPYYQPTTLYLRLTAQNTIPDEPFLFVVGTSRLSYEILKHIPRPQSSNSTSP